MGQIAKMGKKCAYADIPTSQMILAVYLSGAGKSREIHLIFQKSGIVRKFTCLAILWQFSGKGKPLNSAGM